MFIYARFEALRAEKGITKAFIAEKLNRTPSICQDWKYGKSVPNEEQLRIVADLLETTPAYLTGESNEKKPAPEGELVNGDPELTAYIQDLKDRPELRMLFSLTHNATREDVERAVRVIEALRHTDNPGQE